MKFIKNNDKNASNISQSNSDNKSDAKITPNLSRSNPVSPQMKPDDIKNNDKNLSIVDVKNCIVDIAETNLEDFCNNFCIFNKSETFRILHKIFEENIELIVVIRMLVRYFMQLQKIRFLVLAPIIM